MNIIIQKKNEILVAFFSVIHNQSVPFEIKGGLGSRKMYIKYMNINVWSNFNCIFVVKLLWKKNVYSKPTNNKYEYINFVFSIYFCSRIELHDLRKKSI